MENKLELFKTTLASLNEQSFTMGQLSIIAFAHEDELKELEDKLKTNIDTSTKKAISLMQELIDMYIKELLATQNLSNIK